jgi:hypothetical protein
MKTRLNLGVTLMALLMLVGCVDREAEARRAREEAEAKARAEAASKEMNALPKAFKSPEFFKLNEPDPKAAPQPAPTPEKKQNP